MNSFENVDLKAIKIQIRRQIPSTATISDEIDYQIPNINEVSVNRKKDEGNIPIFNRTDIRVNQYDSKEEVVNSKAKQSSPTKKSFRTVPDESINENKRESIAKETRKHVLKNIDKFARRSRSRRRARSHSSSEDDEMFTLIKETMGSSFKMFDKNSSSKKRNRTNSNYSSSSSPSPIPKRLRNDYSGKYGHSSKLDSDLFDKSNKHSNSSNPFRNKRKSSPYSSESCSSSEKYHKNKSKRRHRDEKSKSKYRHSHKRYPPRGMTSNDIEERYYRYYAVMYAFTIIMDILRQDGINSF